MAEVKKQVCKYCGHILNGKRHVKCFLAWKNGRRNIINKIDNDGFVYGVSNRNQ